MLMYESAEGYSLKVKRKITPIYLFAEFISSHVIRLHRNCNITLLCSIYYNNLYTMYYNL